MSDYVYYMEHEDSHPEDDPRPRMVWRFKHGQRNGEVIDANNPDDTWQPSYCSLRDMFPEENINEGFLPQHLRP